MLAIPTILIISLFWAELLMNFVKYISSFFNLIIERVFSIGRIINGVLLLFFWLVLFAVVMTISPLASIGHLRVRSNIISKVSWLFVFSFRLSSWSNVKSFFWNFWNCQDIFSSIFVDVIFSMKSWKSFDSRNSEWEFFWIWDVLRDSLCGSFIFSQETFLCA